METHEFTVLSSRCLGSAELYWLVFIRWHQTDPLFPVLLNQSIESMQTAGSFSRNEGCDFRKQSRLNAFENGTRSVFCSKLGK
jgi:hypothetical protein